MSYLHDLGDHFNFFVREIWRDRRLDQPGIAPIGDVEEDILDWTANGPRKRGVLAFRGIGKTHLITASYTLWRLFRDHDNKVLIVSKSLGEAKKTVGIMRQWIDAVEFLRHLSPELGHDKTDTRNEFSVGPAKEARDFSVTAVGVDGQLPSKRAHLIIADDTETKENTKTFEGRKELLETVTEFRAIASFGDKEIVYVGTPHHEETLYTALEARGYAFRSWPKTYPLPEERVRNLAPMLADRLARGLAHPGGLTCPHRITQQDIIDDQKEGRRFWLMQCQLASDMGDSDQYPLRLADIMVMDVARDSAPISVVYGAMDHNGSTAINNPGGDNPGGITSLGFGLDRFCRPARVSKETARYAATVAWIDPAGKTGKDHTALCAVGYLAGLYHVKKAVAFPGGGTEKNFVAIALALRESGSRQVGIESNWGGSAEFAASFDSVLRRFYTRPGEHPEFPDGWTCSPITDTKITHSSGQKELRILGVLEPVLTGHRAVFDRQVAENQDLQHQITRLTRQRDALAEDGLIDALAGAVHALGHTLRIDPQKAAAAAHDRFAEDERDSFLESIGIPRRQKVPANWINRE